MVEIPCGVCSTPIPSSCHRYGGRSCNACGAFFIRAIVSEKPFKCLGSNDCLQKPSLLGKGCRKCRLAKCWEIGMHANGMPAPAPQPVEVVPPPPAPPAAVAVVADKSTIFASVLNSILTAATTYQKSLEAYLIENNHEVISLGCKNMEGVELTPMSEKITLLSFVLTKFPIDLNELPAFIHLSLCKAELKWLPFQEQTKLRVLQNQALLGIGNFNVFGNRLIELSNISQHFLNIFYIFCQSNSPLIL